MIVSDKDLKQLVENMHFETEDPKHPFTSNEQVQPASIDLRLDQVFWIPRRPGVRVFRKLDLRHLSQSANQIERLYKRRRLSQGEGIPIRPGEMLLARVYEKFTVPPSHAARIAGRSSFARLGLSVTCSGDHINPGYRGHMPLQIVNHGRVPVVVYPFMPICQLILCQLTTSAETPYGTPGQNHKYQEDVGGPSKYYEDLRLQRLNEMMGGINLPSHVMSEFKRVLESEDRGVLDRFDAYVRTIPLDQITNARDVLEAFARKDKRNGKIFEILRTGFKWGAGITFGLSLTLYFRPPYEPGYFVVWIIAAILAPIGLYLKFMAAPAPTRLEPSLVDEKFPD